MRAGPSGRRRSATGTTQVKQMPVPHAICSSTATWQGTPCCPATRLTAASIGIGPQAKTCPTWSRPSSSGIGSVTIPRCPTVPSSVVTVRVWPSRLASMASNRRSAVAAPTRKSTRQRRTRSSSARKNRAAVP
jgi:hypothetical protein